MSRPGPTRHLSALARQPRALAWHPRALARLLAVALLGAGAGAPIALAGSSGGSGMSGQSTTSASTTGGAGPSGSPGSSGSSRTRIKPKRKQAPPPPGAPAHAHGSWIGGFTVTEYWPVPESWFVGKLVSAPGLPGKHRIDWLYSAEGVSMEGDGVGLDGQPYHIDSLGDGGWVTVDGKPTDPAKGWNGGSPYWRAGGYWKNAQGAVTFPLEAGGWSNGPGRKYVPLRGVTFAPGASLPLSPYRSIAVDPKLIPLGSLVYVPAYRADGHGGWFVAQDTGGAINKRHIDVYRTPPASPAEGGQYLTGERVYVIKASPSAPAG